LSHNLQRRISVVRQTPGSLLVLQVFSVPKPFKEQTEICGTWLKRVVKGLQRTKVMLGTHLAGHVEEGSLRRVVNGYWLASIAPFGSGLLNFLGPLH
jgi:hypothetical protein